MLRIAFLTFMVASVLLQVVSCGRNKASETTAAGEVEKHVAFGEFQPVESRALLEASLPLVFDKEHNLVDSCLAKAVGLAEPVPSEEQLAVIEKNRDQLTSLAMDWLVPMLADEGVTKKITDTWKVELVDLAALSVTEDQLKFVDEPKCIEEETKWFPPGMNVIGTLYGAGAFKFSTEVAMDGVLQAKMLAGFEELGARVNVASYQFFEPALDKNGAPMVNFDNEKLFTSPSGEFIPEKQLPPLDQRAAKEWTVTLEQPHFWAAGEFPALWKNENTAEVCDSFLIWDDPTPLIPDCEEFNESGFSVSYLADTDEVVLTVTSYGTNVGAVIKYDETTMIRAEDNVLVWVTPKKIEEGVLLLSDSFVLRAGPQLPVAEVAAAPEPAPVVEKPKEPAVEDVVKAALEAEAAAEAAAKEKAKAKKQEVFELPK